MKNLSLMFLLTVLVSSGFALEPLRAESDYKCAVQVAGTAVQDTIYLRLSWTAHSSTGHQSPFTKNLFVRSQQEYNFGIRIPSGRPDTPLEIFLRPFHDGGEAPTFADNFRISLSLDLRSKDRKDKGPVGPDTPYDLKDFSDFQGWDFDGSETSLQVQQPTAGQYQIIYTRTMTDAKDAPANLVLTGICAKHQ